MTDSPAAATRVQEPSSTRRNHLRLSSFDPRRNGGLLLYLVFSVSVVASHDVLLGGFNPRWRTTWSGGLVSIGGPAVAGFFSVGGFLIARSARSAGNYRRYVALRVSRIFPPYLASLVLTAVVFAPLVWTLTRDRLSEFRGRLTTARWSTH